MAAAAEAVNSSSVDLLYNGVASVTGKRGSSDIGSLAPQRRRPRCAAHTRTISAHGALEHVTKRLKASPAADALLELGRARWPG